jgi:hypothetical protein
VPLTPTHSLREWVGVRGTAGGGMYAKYAKFGVLENMAAELARLGRYRACGGG